MTRPLVALDALLLRPQPTGVGRVIIELTRELAAADRGLDFAVLCTHPDQLAHLTDRPGWRLIPCPGARGGTLRKAAWTQARLPALVRDLGADLLHCLQFVGPLRPPCPTVVTVYDLAYRLFPDTVEEPRRSYYRALVPRTLHRARRVLAISEATAADIRAAWPDVAPRVTVARLGLPAWLRGREPAPRDRGPDAPFLFVGTLEPRKNLERLVRAYATFRGQRRDEGRSAPRLVLVGSRGWKDSGLRALLEPLVAAGDVVVLNYCDQEELWRQYGLARALLFPSLHEGFGLPILEAMVAGHAGVDQRPRSHGRGGRGCGLISWIRPRPGGHCRRLSGALVDDAALRRRSGGPRAGPLATVELGRNGARRRSRNLSAGSSRTRPGAGADPYDRARYLSGCSQCQGLGIPSARSAESHASRERSKPTEESWSEGSYLWSASAWPSSCRGWCSRTSAISVS